jgi:predicted RNase H-like nuclease
LSNLSFDVEPELDAIFARAGVDSLIAIDIPIGVPDNEPRACDAAARQLLRWPRSSSVFSPPARRALHAKTFAEALRLNREFMGIGISKQAFHIMEKIRQVDDRMDARKQQYVREVHPEVTFAQLNGAPIIHSKRTSSGRRARIALLRTAGLNISDSWLIRERARLGVRRVFHDDLIDALACLVTAAAIRNGRGQRLGDIEQKDVKGLIMEIVCGAGVAQRDSSLAPLWGAVRQSLL